MDNGTLLAGQTLGVDRTLRLRISAVVAAIALVATMFVLAQSPAEASPAANGSVAAAVAGASLDGAAQIGGIDFSQIFCAILTTIFNAFSSSPFFSFIAAALTPILEAFDCVVS